MGNEEIKLILFVMSLLAFAAMAKALGYVG